MTSETSRERTDLLAALNKHRMLLKRTVRDLTDEQAAQRTTASELCPGGLIKHVAKTEEMWQRFATGGAAAMEGGESDWADQFRMLEGETLADLLAEYDRVATRTTALVTELDLDTVHPLPPKPWFEKGAAWSVRQVWLHLIGETAQHAGHADILRESLDGAKSMG